MDSENSCESSYCYVAIRCCRTYRTNVRNRLTNGVEHAYTQTLRVGAGSGIWIALRCRLVVSNRPVFADLALLLIR